MSGRPAGRLILLLAALAFLGGCGTIGGMANADYKSKVYVGLRHDISITTEKDKPATIWIFNILDYPFSLVLDTVCLPGTLVYEIFR